MIDTTMDFNITGPGGNSRAPSTKIDCEMETPFGSAVSPSDAPGANKFPTVSKGETPGIINSVFYDAQNRTPAQIDSIMKEVIEMSFDE